MSDPSLRSGIHQDESFFLYIPLYFPILSNIFFLILEFPQLQIHVKQNFSQYLHLLIEKLMMDAEKLGATYRTYWYWKEVIFLSVLLVVSFLSSVAMLSWHYHTHKSLSTLKHWPFCVFTRFSQLLKGETVTTLCNLEVDRASWPNWWCWNKTI